MTLDELYNLSPDESVERIKDECRSQAKKRLRVGVIATLVIVALLIVVVVMMDRVRFIPTCQLIITCLAAILMAVNNYRFLQRVNSLKTPESLLHGYEKSMNNERKSSHLLLLGFVGNIIDPYAFIRREWDWMLVELVIVAILLAVLAYSYFKGDWVKYKSDRDEDIFRRLQDLIEKE